MSLMRPNLDELRYMRESVLEQCYLLGRKCTIKVPLNVSAPDASVMERYTYGDNAYEYFIQFEDKPKRRLLEKFGFVKDASTVPIIAICPMYRYEFARDDENLSACNRYNTIEQDVTEGTLLSIVRQNTIDDNIEAMYTVENVLVSDDGAYYQVNLVPYREAVSGVKSDTSNSQYILQSDDY